MSISITINGTVRTTDVEQTIRYSQTLSKSPAKFVFSMNQKAGRVIPTVGQSILVQLDAVNFFKGKITDRSDSMAANGIASYQFTCLDGYFDMDKRLVIKAYSDTTLLAVVTDIVTNFMSGFTLDIPATTPTINTVRFNYEQPTSCLKKLCDAAGWDWYVDAYDVIHVKPAADIVAPYVIDETSGNHIPKLLNFDRNINELRNVIFVRGGEYEQPIAEVDAVDTYKANGTDNTFPLVYRYGGTQITVNGTPVTMGVDFLDDPLLFDCLYNYQEKLVRFPTGTLSSGDIVRVFGNAKVPLIVQAQDDDSVLLYGERESVVIDKSIDSISEAELLASSRLEQWREGSKEGSFTSYKDGWKVGQTVTIDSPTFGVSDTYKINRVSARLQTSDTFVYDVEFIKSGQTDFTDLMISLIGKERSNITIADNEVLQKLKRVADGFGVTDEIYTYFKSTGPYVFTQNQNYYRIKITVDYTKVPANQTGFPVYVNLSAFPREFFDRAKSDGGDLRAFASDGTTELPIEVVGYNPVTLTGEVFFKGDLSSTVNTDFYIYFGNKNATAYARTDTYGSNNVWTGCHGVYHATFDNKDSSPTNTAATLYETTQEAGYWDFKGHVTVAESAATLAGTTAMPFGKVTTYQRVGQSFVMSSTPAQDIGIMLRKLANNGSPTATVTCAIQADTAGSPSGTNLLSTTIQWNGAGAPLAVNTDFIAAVMTNAGLVSGTTYWLVLIHTTPSDTNFINVAYDPTGTYGVLKYFDGTTWTVQPGSLRFRVSESGYARIGTPNMSTQNMQMTVLLKKSDSVYESIFDNGISNTSHLEINPVVDSLQWRPNNTSGSSNVTIASGATLGDNTFRALCWRLNATNQTLFVNGANVGTGTANVLATDQVLANIGRVQNRLNAVYGQALKGQVKFVRLRPAQTDQFNATESNNLLSPATFYTVGTVSPISVTPGFFDFATFG